MADYNKIGLLILNDDQTKFMVCEPGDKYEEKRVAQYLMPGGQLDEKDDIECIEREIEEKLGCGVDKNSLKFVGEYEDAAATPGKTVMIKLYRGNLISKPIPSSEVGAIHWISKDDIDNPKLSPIIKNKIIPDLIQRKILK